MGSGTILVEAIVNERQIYGIDINPVSIFFFSA
jgi:DNA modification methylase